MDLTDFDRASCDETRHSAKARNASARRRLIDPTTGERECSALELEFMEAIREYQRSSGRKFLIWSEVLEVARGLGYDNAAGR